MSAEISLPPTISGAASNEVEALPRPLPPTEQVLLSPIEACPPEVVAAFRTSLLARLERHGYAVVVDVVPETRFVATAFVADVLGGVTGAPAGPLGGEITTVLTSSGIDHKFAWHTDSTPWELPNRWQTLTLVNPDAFDRPAPTSVMLWTKLIAQIGPDAAEELARTNYEWREQFPSLPPLSAAVLGSPPRWLRPPLARHLESASDSALRTLAAVIASVDDFVEVDVSESSIVVFDNHAVLHRGPHLESDGGRTILRLKVGGRIGDLLASTR